MMTKIYLSFGTFLLSHSPHTSTLTGLFVEKGKDYKITLSLNSADSSFVFTRSYFERSPTCKGKFSVKKDAILLRCESEPPLSELTTSYLSRRVFSIVVKSDSKLILDEYEFVKNKQKLFRHILKKQ